MFTTNQKWIVENVVKIYLDLNGLGPLQEFVNQRTKLLGFAFDYTAGTWEVIDDSAFMLTLIKYES